MRLIIVNGMPGVGKSTIAKRLSADLKLPLASKDMLKELLFEQVGTASFDDSRFLGKAAIKMLYALVDTYLADDRSLIIENPFYVNFARPDLEKILKQHDVEVVEIYCETSEKTRHQRISQRLADGSRHPGHYDNLTLLEVSNDTYAPLELGEVIHYNTTRDNETAYATLLKRLKA